MSGKYAMRRQHGPCVFEAFRSLVYAADVPKLAALMGLRAGTLYNKADASDESHNQPTLRDVVVASQLTGDLRVLDALNEMFGRASFDALAHADTSDEELLQLLAKVGQEQGEFSGALAFGLQQKRFSPEAMRRVRGEAMDVVGALMTLCARLEAYVEEDADERQA